MMTFNRPMGAGWRERKAENEKRREQRVADYVDSERAAIRQERARMYDEQAARDAAVAAEAAEARLRLRVSCPCCSGSPEGVLVSKAERIMRAWASPLLGRAPDQWNMGHLNAVAVGQDTGAVIVPEGMFYPRAIITPSEPAKVNPKAEPITPTKPRSKHPAEIRTADIDDGALSLED